MLKLCVLLMSSPWQWPNEVSSMQAISLGGEAEAQEGCMAS